MRVLFDDYSCQWNQDLRTVSPWEIVHPSSEVQLATCMANPLTNHELKPSRAAPSSSVAHAITRTIEELYELMVSWHQRDCEQLFQRRNGLILLFCCSFPSGARCGCIRAMPRRLVPPSSRRCSPHPTAHCSACVSSSKRSVAHRQQIKINLR